MEFGVVGQEGIVGLGNGFASTPSDHATKQKCSVSIGHNNGDYKATKVAKLSDDFLLTTNIISSPFKHSSPFGYYYGSQQEHNMLSFSSPKLENKNVQSSAFPHYQHPNSWYSKSSSNVMETYLGYSYSGNVNPSTHFLNGVRGPFTTSQWYELEQQALIYKYIIANEPIPSNLLMPIRRAFESSGFCNFLGGLLRPNTIGYGWGPFHLGYSNTTDPEPGRCRRTDGKKWRCSREAVPDQKYCERHMNRGRHRSRKPVEGQSGHSISEATTNKTRSNATMDSSTSSPLVVSGGGLSNSFAINLDRSNDLLQHVHPNHLPTSLLNRFIVNKDNISQGKQDAAGLDFLSPRICLNSNGHTLSVSESAAGDFSFLTPDAILSNTTTSRGSSTFCANGQSHNCNAQSSLWPKIHTPTEKSQLSILIPPSDLMSSTSSTGEADTYSPLSLSRELSLVQTGSGVGPISWETSSMGGPLGEVLNTSTCNNSSSSPQLASSPTGVLQKTALGYFSNSSAGSSPRAENGKAHDNIGFTLGSSPFNPL